VPNPDPQHNTTACAERGADLLARLLGQLTVEQAHEVELHIACCAGCRAESSRMARHGAHTSGLVELEPPRAVLDRLLASVAHEAEERRVEAALTRSRACPGRGEELTALAFGALGRVEAATVEAHLSECGACAHEHAGAVRLVRAARSAPQLEPRAQTFGRVVAAVGADRGQEPGPERKAALPDAPAPGRVRRRSLSLLPLLVPAAAAAAWLLAVGLDDAREDAPGPVAAHVEHGAAYLSRAFRDPPPGDARSPAP
jgi:anti-sigma factor RsiW